MLIRAARCARSVGDDTFAHDAESAISKLTYDFGVALGSVAGESERDAAVDTDAHSAPALRALGDALLRRKTVTFEYHSMNRDAVDRRTVEPYGLFFASGHWYLAGRDTSLGALRKFRLSRIRDLAKNAKKPQTPDYEVPKDFNLAAEARSKEAWELGDQAPEDMIVEIRGDSSATAVGSLGDAVEGAPNRRRFRVRRADSFVRWIMSFAGAVAPISPPSLVEHYDRVVAATLAQYNERRRRRSARAIIAVHAAHRRPWRCADPRSARRSRCGRAHAARRPSRAHRARRRACARPHRGGDDSLRA
jgi:predicted DNA-binding transcriptional regulator YafY